MALAFPSLKRHPKKKSGPTLDILDGRRVLQILNKVDELAEARRLVAELEERVALREREIAARRKLDALEATSS